MYSILKFSTVQNILKIGVITIMGISITSCSKERRSDKKAENMQEFVVELSNYAKGIDSDFIIIPQNGPELAFSNLDQNDGIHQDYW